MWKSGSPKGPDLPRSEWPRVAAKLHALDGNARKRGAALAAAAANSDPAAAIEEYFSVFFTGDGDPRADGGFGNQGARAQEPDLFTRLFKERDRLVPLRDKRAAANARERSAALLALAGAVIGRYEKMKAERGVLDFGDLVRQDRGSPVRHGSRPGCTTSSTAASITF